MPTSLRPTEQILGLDHVLLVRSLYDQLILRLIVRIKRNSTCKVFSRVPGT